MDKEEFKSKMKLLQELSDEDIESAHIKADALLCNQLSELGYSEGIEIFQCMKKYYA